MRLNITTRPRNDGNDFNGQYRSLFVSTLLVKQN